MRAQRIWLGSPLLARHDRGGRRGHHGCAMCGCDLQRSVAGNWYVADGQLRRYHARAECHDIRKGFRSRRGGKAEHPVQAATRTQHSRRGPLGESQYQGEPGKQVSSATQHSDRHCQGLPLGQTASASVRVVTRWGHGVESFCAAAHDTDSGTKLTRSLGLPWTRRGQRADGCTQSHCARVLACTPLVHHAASGRGVVTAGCRSGQDAEELQVGPHRADLGGGESGRVRAMYRYLACPVSQACCPHRQVRQ
jgi:hypothetical protein